MRPSYPKSFHVMAKPAGSACNLRCEYCFFLDKKSLYPGSGFRMGDNVHREYIRQLLDAHQTTRVTVAWQGGEPTLMGLDFYRRSLELQERYRKSSTVIENTFQTNGILLNDEWCSFFRKSNFLVGLSIDGPQRLHDRYRRDARGNGSFDRVLKAARLLQRHGVEFNILSTVNRKNMDHPLEVYRFFRDVLGARYIQFIPIVEREDADTIRTGGRITGRSVSPARWGSFLNSIFDEWVSCDVGETFVLNFDAVLAGWLGHAGTVCIFGPTCGLGVALEHNGDLYSCDHFVDTNHLLGNILTTPMIELVSSEKQRRFGRDKAGTIPRQCRECRYLFLCNGECPKNRLIETAEGEPGLNYLCEGYRAFFSHTEKPMQAMANLMRNGRPASDVMRLTTGEKPSVHASFPGVGRNDPCPCGARDASGKRMKFKKCHGGER
ncbi:MAG: anaerobic sulfatase maturase [Pseudomonadota bacterium]|nr:anaerobic sulfatase maturase [Pseudomonadota bacterium]HPD22676.1 anaerobic sulfatase maturase [Deltaproteobacteria bacterium]HPX18480.1 anaerobic sulfatase maturase [Deltaproteobacteria bacterium]HRS57471.1 anaerobic sulfatase maturase [Desulfomonilia bacterium]HRV36152.1 anaerobic sulfatase maturase [Desulfomonilia bacterium]